MGACHGHVSQPLRVVPGRKEVDSDPSPALGCTSLTDPERLCVHELIGHSGFLPVCLQLLSVSTRLSASLADRRGEYIPGINLPSGESASALLRCLMFIFVSRSFILQTI